RVALRIEDTTSGAGRRRRVEQNSVACIDCDVADRNGAIRTARERRNDLLRGVEAGGRRIDREPVLAREARRIGNALELVLEFGDVCLNFAAIDARSEGGG